VSATARRPYHRPLAHPRRHRDLARLQQHRPEIPEYIPDNCTGCMDCVTECPDTAILGKVMSETEWNAKMLTIPEADRERFKKEWSKTKKYYDAYKKKLGDGGMFNIIIDPSSAGLCRVRDGVRRRRPQNDREERRRHDVVAQGPSLLQEHRPSTTSTSATVC